MIYKHKHIRDIDLGETIPNLHIDLEKAVETHTIRDTGVTPEFNAIESTEEVGTIIRDQFQALDEVNRIQAQAREMALRSTEQVSKQTQSATEQQTSTTQSE